MSCSSKVSKGRRHWVHGARADAACRCHVQARIGVIGFMAHELRQPVDVMFKQGKLASYSESL